MKFNYQARDKEGKIQSGVVEASSKEAALDVLQKYGLVVTFLEEKSALPFYAKRIKVFEKVARRDIVAFSRQLSIMFKSQIPLIESLEVLAFQASREGFKETLLKINEEIEAGVTFSKALSRYPRVFSTFYISMVKSGEASGKLAESLEYLAEHLERDYHLKSTIRGAFIYPIFLLFVLGIVGVLLIFMVMPQITEILQEAGGELPLVTKVVIGFSEFLRTKGWILIIILTVSAFFTWKYSKTEEGKVAVDKLILKIPLLNKFLRKIYISRFAENLSTLIAGGLPIARALEITGEVVGNNVYKRTILETRDGVRKGNTISSILREYPETFPPMFIQMVVVGERTGRLDSSLLNVVDFYQQEVDRAVNSFLKFLEPSLIVIFGIGVGIFVMSVMMPLYEIYQVGGV